MSVRCHEEILHYEGLVLPVVKIKHLLQTTNIHCKILLCCSSFHRTENRSNHFLYKVSKKKCAYFDVTYILEFHLFYKQSHDPTIIL